MKKKLHSIVFAEKEFVYSVKEKLSKHPDTEQLVWKNTIRIFRQAYKSTPLIIKLLCKDDYYMGNPLTKEIIPGLNLNDPELIRRFVEEGVEQGWNWKETKMKLANGMELLKKMGFDVRLMEL